MTSRCCSGMRGTAFKALQGPAVLHGRAPYRHFATVEATGNRQQALHSPALTRAAEKATVLRLRGHGPQYAVSPVPSKYPNILVPQQLHDPTAPLSVKLLR